MTWIIRGGAPAASAIVAAGETMADEPWTHREEEVNGVRLHWVEQGEGPLVVLLHGFPDFWFTWRRQLPALAAAGFRAVAPDMRGYGLSGKPRGVAEYRMDRLVDDVAGLVARCGATRAHVAGHDWGGAVAWNLPRYHPDLVDRLVILNSPHPAAFRRELRTLDQLRRSWYVFFFQLPWLPEALLARRRAGFVKGLLRRELVAKDAFTREEIERHREAMLVPGALTAALAYYRAAFRVRAVPAKGPRRIERPTLVVWGERDSFLSPRLLDGLDRWVADLTVERLPGAGHWVHADAPARVNELLVGFFRGGGVRPEGASGPLPPPPRA